MIGKGEPVGSVARSSTSAEYTLRAHTTGSARARTNSWGTCIRFSARVCAIGWTLAICLLMTTTGCHKSSSPNPESTSGSPSTQSATPADGSDKPQSLADRLKAVQSGQADGTGKPALPDWKPVVSPVPGPDIPLVKGLVVVTAISDPIGDYESIKTIQDVSPTAITMGYSADKPAPKMTGLLGGAEKGLADPKNEFPDKVSCVRIIDAKDLVNAHSYSEYFCENKTEHFPGSTSISASTEVLNQIRSGQEAEFHFSSDKWSLLLQIGEQFSGHKPSGPTLTPHAGQPMYTCNLHRVEPGDLSVPVLLNDQRVQLPALHAMCTLDDGEEAHLYYLDQPANPITLAFQLGPAAARLQVIRITLPPPEAEPRASGGGGGGGPSQMEHSLADKKPVEVYGIYFDFNSATIKPESEAVLLQIADIMRKNPDWKLSVSGHTDDIGGDSFNQALSERRAASVKNALVTDYKIAPDRLATAGYGASRPIETNKTMEGRARNRRVELQRL